MKLFLSILLLLLVVDFQAQTIDSIQEEDTVYIESRRNYLGVNISPLLTGAFGGSNKSSKINLSYKRNMGNRNFRVSLNYLTLANRTPYTSYRTIASNNTMITNRYYSSWYDHYDVRIGFEELKGSNFSRFHIGVDLIFGYAQFHSKYDDVNLHKDTTGFYLVDDNEAPVYQGSHDSNYFTTGLDLSFGFDWFLSEDLLVTFQLTPQFNYFIIDTDRLIDQYNQYGLSQNFADFNLGYFDVSLFYKF